MATTGARQPLLLRQRAELQSQVLSSPAPRDGPQVSTPARPARPRRPHPVLTLLSPPTCTGSLSHPREPRPSWARPPAPCRPSWAVTWLPGPPWADPSPPQLLHQTRAQSWAEQGGGRCCNRPGRHRGNRRGRGLGLPAFKDPLKAGSVETPPLGREHPEPRSAGSLSQPHQRAAAEETVGPRPEAGGAPTLPACPWEATGHHLPAFLGEAGYMALPGPHVKYRLDTALCILATLRAWYIPHSHNPSQPCAP